MDRFYPNQPFVVYFKSVESNPLRNLFISKRLYKLITKKTGEGRWAFVVFSIKLPEYYGYKPVLMNPYGKAIYSIKL